MAAKKSTDPTHQFSTVRVAPLGELKAYTLHEHELDLIAAGSSATLAFNVAIALISSGISFVLTLTTTTIESNRLFYSYLIVCFNCFLVGFFMLGKWVMSRTSVDLMVREIKSRLIVPQLIQEPLPGEPGRSSPSTPP